MSRLPRALARRIDRLAWRAHAFHRLAHHPLCLPYRSEVLALGRRARICRGCSLVATGLAAGVAAGLALAPLAPGPLASLLALFLAAAAAAVGAAGRPSRRPKALTRLVPAALGALVVAAGLASPSPWGLAAAAGACATFALAVGAYRRRGPDRAPCLTCPERTGTVVCSGYRPMARRERAFRRLAGRWMAGV